MPFIVFMKKRGDSEQNLPDNQKNKVVEAFRANAEKPDDDFPYLKADAYQSLKKQIIKLYFDEYFRITLLGAAVSDLEESFNTQENAIRERYGAFEKGNKENPETTADLKAARDLGKKRVDDFYSELKGQLKKYFTGNIEQDRPNILKIRESQFIIGDWYDGKPTWKRAAQNILEPSTAQANIIRLCEDVEYTIYGNPTRLQAEISITAGSTTDPNNPNIISITRDGKTVRFQKFQDLQTRDGTFCYRILDISDDILTTFPEIKTAPLLNNANQSTPDGRPTPEQAAEEARKRSGAIEEIFGDFDKFDQQCVLLKLIDKIVDLNKENGEKNTFEGIVALEAENLNEARIITNLINGSSRFQPFVNIPNYIMPALMPKIRLIKSYLKEDNSQVDIEIPLEEFVNQEDILVENIARGFGFGLKTFSWENTSFNEVDRNIDAHLVLKFSNMDSFIKIREGKVIGLTGTPPPDIEKFQKFKFLDLIYQVPTDKDKQKEAMLIAAAEGLVPNKFHIKISVGWSFDENVLANLVEKSELEPLKTAILANNVVFYLFNKGHDLSFEKDGGVTVDINYQSAQEARMNDEEYSNVLNILDELKIKKLSETRKEAESIQRAIEEEPREEKKTELSEGLEKALNEQTTLETELNSDIYRKFILELYKTKAVKLAAINGSDLVKLKLSLTPFKENSRPNIRRLNDLENKIYDNEDIEKIKTLLQTRITEKTEKIIPYFYFGDLLSLVIKIINRDTTKEKLKLALGPYVYQRFISENLKNENKTKQFGSFKDRLRIINIGDIPISMDYFIFWFEEEIVKKGRRAYTLRTFLSNIINKLIIQVLRPSCFGKNFAIGNYKLDVHLLNVIRDNQTDPLSLTHYNKLGNIRRPIAKTKGVLDNSINFLISERLQTIPYIYIQLMYINENKMIANEDINRMQGIYHLRLGAERGLVKEINFAKDDNKYIAPAIYAQQGVVTPGVLSVPYNAEISMVGNTIFKPGAIVYVDPSFMLSVPSLRGAGRNVIKQMRLGGFYLITRTRNVIESGRFNTTVSARWVAQGEETSG